MYKKEVAVIVPIYKNELSCLEKISWKQALRIFKQYDIIIVAPEELCMELEGKYEGIERFSGKYFESVEEYNMLRLTTSFYQRFERYEYILIYQLDAFVFSEKLSFWCGLGYDYIGAPWLYGLFYYVDETHCIWHVGNGGLSLRRVSSFINILQERNPLQKEKIPNEDLFFSAVNSEFFVIAPLKIALQFSFEQQVEECFGLNGYSLPFGCHAWGKYNFNFWKPYIEQQGYSLPELWNSGNEDRLLKDRYDGMQFLAKVWNDQNIGELVYNKLVMNIRVEGIKYILFGAGYLGKGLAKWLVHNHIPFQGYCDNNAEIYNRQVDGYLIMQPKELVRYKGKVIIIISLVNHVHEVMEQLEQMEFKYNVDYITYRDIMNIG